MPSVFEKEYSKLNPAQKTAVDNIEGPLLVLAGPGTGKTQLLSLRVANILSKTDTIPENILCLTFTDPAANEMRRRLINMIGSEAYKVTIGTYHSFGSDIIKNNLSYFNNLNLRPINDLKASAIIREIQNTLPYTSALKNSYQINNIKSLIGYTKQALLDPRDIAKVAEANLATIATLSDATKLLTNDLRRMSLKSLPALKKLLEKIGKAKDLPANIQDLGNIIKIELTQAIDEAEDINKSTPLTHWKNRFLTKDHHDEQVIKGADQNHKLKEFANIYKAYQQKLSKDSLYDFNDMILTSIKALKMHDDLRFSLQEKYQYILLDEYQDTNQAQAELIHLLTDNPVNEGRPNIMAVGDDDQAIFSFQGAKHFNMLDFANKYQEVTQITLKTSYRSPQALIDFSSLAANQISERLTTSLGIANKKLLASRKTKSQIKNLKVSNEVDQYAWLAKELKTKENQSVAVIAPEHKYLERASAYLIEQGIKVSYTRQEDILDNPLIDQIITTIGLLSAINDQDNRLTDSLLAVVLNYEFLNLETETIWQLSWKANESHTPWLKLMLKNPKTRNTALMFLKLASNSLSYQYDFIIDQIIGLSDIVLNDPKLKATRSPFLSYYEKTLTKSDIARLFQNLITIKQQLNDYFLDNSQPLMITDLLEFIDQVRSSQVRLINNFNEGQENSSVKLMTAHSVKGLEFDNVYLLSVINEAWGPKSNRNRFSLPPNLEYIRSKPDDSDDERLRLLYVALSRAKNNLTNLSYDFDLNTKPTTPIKFLKIDFTPVKAPSQSDARVLWQQEKGQPVAIPTELKDLLKNRLDNYILSPTDLNSFIDVRHAGPEKFYKTAILKYQTPLSAKVHYGSAIHASLDWLQKTLNQTAKLPSLNELILEFNDQLKKQRLSLVDFNHFITQGKDSLMAYYTLNKQLFSPKDISEYNFRQEGISINNARLTGKIDKLIIDDRNKSLTIVDYKTSRPYKSWSNTPKAHLNKNQLYFYKLLASKSTKFKGYSIHQGALDFIDKDPKTNESYSLKLSYQEDELRRLIKLIDAVWSHIEDLNFPSITKYQANIKGILAFEDDLINGKI